MSIAGNFSSSCSPSASFPLLSKGTDSEPVNSSKGSSGRGPRERSHGSIVGFVAAEDCC